MKLYLVLAATTLISSAALAQNQGAPSTQSVFESLDTNKDGRVSPSEAQAQPVVVQSFQAADANKDGVLTRDEFSAAFTMRSPESTTPPPAPPPE